MELEKLIDKYSSELNRDRDELQRYNGNSKIYLLNDIVSDLHNLKSKNGNR